MSVYVNGLELGKIAQVVSKISAGVEDLDCIDGRLLIVGKLSNVVIENSCFKSFETNFRTDKKVLENIFSLLSTNVDYEFVTSEKDITFRNESKKATLKIKQVNKSSEIEELMNADTELLDVDFSRIMEAGRFTSSQVVDVLGFVHILDDGIYAGSSTFVVKYSSPVLLSAGIGVSSKELQVLTGCTDISIKVIRDRGILRVDGNNDGLVITVFCKMIELKNKNMLKDVFNVEEYGSAVVELANGDIKTACNKIIDPTVDIVRLFQKGSEVWYEIDKSNMHWEGVFGILKEGTWIEQKIDGNDFLAIIEKAEIVRQAKNRILVIGEGGNFTGVGAVLV